MINGFDIRQIDLSAPPPIAEPVRQFYYMAAVRSLLGLDRKSLKAHILVMGCQMNAKDAEKLTGILTGIGYEMTSEESQADLVMYLTCTIRENANQKVYGRLGFLGTLKKKKPDMIVALCGCMTQEESALEKIKKSYRFVDLIFGTYNVYALAELLYRTLTEKRPVISILKDQVPVVENLPAVRKYPFKSGVNIMFGCNNFCTYCIVPYVRGREVSRKPEDVVEEVKKLADDGVTEIMLLGQNVNSYGRGLAEPVTFAELLRLCCQVPGIRRIRFMSSHPKDLSDDLIRVMAANPKICPHLHLAMQSGSTEVLRRMNRHYTKEDFLALAKKLKAAIPGIAFTTDIMVGFPGETEEDFCDTLDVIKRVRFDGAYTFIFSPRRGTPAYDMPPLDEAVVKDRFDRLLATQNAISAELCAQREGRVEEVLVEEENAAMPGYVTGRLGSNLCVHFPGDPGLIGQYLRVKLEKACGFYYMGRRVGEGDLPLVE